MRDCGKRKQVLLYCHDGPIYRDQEGRYYDYSLSRRFLVQYFAIAKQVRLMVRVRPFSAAGNPSRCMNPLDMPSLSVVEIGDLKRVGSVRHLRETKKRICEQVSQANLLVCRFSGPTADLAAAEARRRGIPYLAECVNCAWDINWYHSIVGKCVAPLSFLAARRGIRQASHVLYVSGFFLQKRYPTQGKSLGWPDAVLENVRGKVPEKYSRSVGRAGRIVLGTAGGLDPVFKGQTYVIRALALLKREGDTRFFYRMAGPGTGERIRRLAHRLGVEDQIEICGCLNGERMRGWYDSLDLYLQPSLTEGMPRALLEAMATGTAAAGSCVGGSAELLHPDAQFPRGRRGIRPLCELLRRINTEVLSQLSAYGLQIARKYRYERSAGIRIAFYRGYREEADNGDQDSSYCANSGSGRD
ncbi:MAG: glycosyltransferase [Lachnospiraceae bacterium]|nr:glycosyltransferase [Lachnospiraceae bacterium]